MFIPLDHVFALLVAVVLPVYAVVWGQPRMKRLLAEGGPGVRIRTYWWNIGLQWALVAALFLLWRYANRTPEKLGFGLTVDWRLWLGCGLAIAAGGALMLHYRSLTRDAAGRSAVLEQLQKAAPFFPRSRREVNHFSVLAVTAGICEEILFRGFLIWYLWHLIGDGESGVALAAALVLSSLVFGFGHLYQGVTGAIQVVVLALIFGTLFVMTRSLWVPMALHVFIDLLGAATGMRVRNAAVEDSDPTAPGPEPRAVSETVPEPVPDQGRTPIEDSPHHE